MEEGSFFVIDVELFVVELLVVELDRWIVVQSEIDRRLLINH